ncbi:MAG: ribbon-helix-helix protein, CopG family [Spirochaetaceae bacterium]|nr:MAG: ribbon-helix-helix protein, CopG family [Spirochaetaceae bacterium]
MTSHGGILAKSKSSSGKSSSAKKNTSLRLKSETLKELKHLAIEEDTSVQNIIEKLIEQHLNKKRKK